MYRDSIYKRYQPAVTDPGKDGGPAYWFAFHMSKMLVHFENGIYSVPFLKTLAEINIPAVRTQYLGELMGRPCYSAELSDDSTQPAGMAFVELRSLYGSIDEDLFLLAGKAFQIVSWDQTHQFCGRCGSPTAEQPGERAKICPKCGFISYPRICPAVITAVTRDNKLLLAHAKGFKDNMYSLIAGFAEPGETLEEAVAREIMEEVGLKVKNIKYFSSQPWPFPNSLMIGFTAEYASGEVQSDGVEITDAGWYDVDALPGLPPDLSIARQIINGWIEEHTR